MDDTKGNCYEVRKAIIGAGYRLVVNGYELDRLYTTEGEAERRAREIMARVLELG